MTGSHADLWWLPVGAGGRVVVRTSRWWESLRALRARRAPRPLFHAALEVFDGEAGYVIEMTPAWGGPVGPRGVVAEGPVGSRRLGGSRLFRYEIRCWKDGVIPDRRWAVEPPRRLALSPAAAGALIARVGRAPRFVWGRDPFGIVMEEVKSPTVAVIKGKETILLGTYAEDLKRQERVLDSLAEYRPDGMILCPAGGSTAESE